MTLSFWLLYYRPDLRRALIFQSFMADQWSNRLFFQGLLFSLTLGFVFPFALVGGTRTAIHRER